MTEKIDEFKQELKVAVQAIQEVARETGVPFSEASVGSIAQTYLNNKGKDLRTEKISAQQSPKGALKNGNGNGNSNGNGGNVSVPAGSNGHHGKSFHNHANGVAHQNADKPATDGQFKLLYKLAGKFAEKPRAYLEEEMFGKPLKSVTRKEASDAIGALRDLQNGNPNTMTTFRESHSCNGNGVGTKTQAQPQAQTQKPSSVSPDNADKPATEKQKNLLLGLAEDFDPAEPENYIQYVYGKFPDTMTMLEASKAISELKASQQSASA